MVPEHFIHKHLPLKFDGAELSLAASHALFSSYQIDKGSLFLLKTLAQSSYLEEASNLLDWGCGIGTLALAVKKRHPHLLVDAMDRDMRAVVFTEFNAQSNDLEIDVFPGLGHVGLQNSYSRILTNWPAKSGDGVLKDFVESCGTILKKDGKVAMVIVSSLAGKLLKLLDDSGALILFKEKNRDYLVVHFSTPSKKSPRAEAYLRLKSSFQLAKVKYSLETVTGIADFDRLSFAQELAGSLMLKTTTPVGFWAPGQGHLAVQGKKLGLGSPKLLLGPDMLELWISSRNTQSPQAASLIPFASWIPENMERGVLGSLIWNYHPTPKTPEEEEIWAAMDYLVDSPGKILVFGKSAHLHQLLEHNPGFRVQQSRKKNGFRAVLLEK